VLFLDLVLFHSIICCFTVWSEDTWLQEHAGETMTEGEKGNSESNPKRAAQSDTVSAL